MYYRFNMWDAFLAKDFLTLKAYMYIESNVYIKMYTGRI